jgi:hypothetical protein
VKVSDVVCLEEQDWCVLEGLRKTINNRSHYSRCPGRDSNLGLPNMQHECCRPLCVVTRKNTFLLLPTSRPRTSTPHNLMFNVYKSSSLLKRNLKTLCIYSNGTHGSHSSYSLMLRTAVVFCVIRNAAFQ